MSFNVSDNRSFTESVINRDYLLDEAVDWIRGNLSPEDVFDTAALSDWAVHHGYVEADV